MNNLMNWLECDDEMKMDTFLQNFDDETALRKFAILNAESIESYLSDPRSKIAIVVAKGFVNDEVSAEDLEKAYLEAESACEEIEAAFMSEDDPTETEEGIENAALVALWVAYPDRFAGASSLECARDAALHTAHYCFQINGSKALKNQLERFKESGLLNASSTEDVS